jgi:hypothetical protein
MARKSREKSEEMIAVTQLRNSAFSGAFVGANRRRRSLQTISLFARKPIDGRLHCTTLDFSENPRTEHGIGCIHVCHPRPRFDSVIGAMAEM